MDYVERVKCGLRMPDFLWRLFPLDENQGQVKNPSACESDKKPLSAWQKKGFFLNPVVLKTFALHFHETEKAHAEAAAVQAFDYPIGALALSASAVSSTYITVPYL